MVRLNLRAARRNFPSSASAARLQVQNSKYGTQMWENTELIIKQEIPFKFNQAEKKVRNSNFITYYHVVLQKKCKYNGIIIIFLKKVHCYFMHLSLEKIMKMMFTLPWVKLRKRKYVWVDRFRFIKHWRRDSLGPGCTLARNYLLLTETVTKPI